MDNKQVIRIIRSIKDILDDIMTVHEDDLSKQKTYSAFMDSWDLLFKQNISDKDSLVIIIKEFNANLDNLMKRLPENIRNSQLFKELKVKVNELWTAVNS